MPCLLLQSAFKFRDIPVLPLKPHRSPEAYMLYAKLERCVYALYTDKARGLARGFGGLALPGRLALLQDAVLEEMEMPVINFTGASSAMVTHSELLIAIARRRVGLKLGKLVVLQETQFCQQ